MNKKGIIDWIEGNENNNIKSWLNNDGIKNLFDDNLVKCINECTSPKNNPGKPIDNEDLKLIFNAFSLFEPQNTRVLILGKDPYPESSKAEGLAFSVNENYNKIDSSLKNIYVASKVDVTNKTNKSLILWAKENAILLLNTALTYQKLNVSEEEQRACQREHIKVWEPFINEIIKKLIFENRNKLVVFLWGAHAQIAFFNAIREIEKIEPDKCYLMRKMILMTSHPSNNGQAHTKGFDKDSPKHFKACDEFLDKDIWKSLNRYQNNK